MSAGFLGLSFKTFDMSAEKKDVLVVIMKLTKFSKPFKFSICQKLKYKYDGPFLACRLFVVVDSGYVILELSDGVDYSRGRGNAESDGSLESRVFRNNAGLTSLSPKLRVLYKVFSCSSRSSTTPHKASTMWSYITAQLVSSFGSEGGLEREPSMWDQTT